MTGADNGQPITYKVDMSGTVGQEIKNLLQQADLQGIEPDVIRALKIIFNRLRNDPLQFGELYQHHKHFELLVHVAVVYPVVVHFGIHQEKRFVIIRKIFLLLPGIIE